MWSQGVFTMIPAHSYKYYKLLIATQSCNNLNTEQTNTLISHNYLYMFDNDCIAGLLPCVSHSAGSVLHPFVVTRSPPVPGCLSPITRISHRSPGSAQPCHPRPRWLQRIVSCELCDHKYPGEMTPDRCSIVPSRSQ